MEDRRPAPRKGSSFTKSVFIDQVPGDWIAEKLGYTGGRCILDDHSKYPRSNSLHRYGDPEIVWYGCWPCDVNVNAYDLLKATIARSDSAGDLEAQTRIRAEALYKEWQTVRGWESDASLFRGGSSSWTDLRAGDPGSSSPATSEDLQQRLDEARDPDRFAKVFENYCRDRKEKTYPAGFDSFDEVDPSFITESFGWAATEFDSFMVPLRSPDGELMNIQRLTARKRSVEPGHIVPTLYGLDRRREEATILIVEGIPDTVRLAWEYRDEADLMVIGLTSASFSAGAVPTEAFEGTAVTILGDGDDAGRRATEKLADTLAKVASISIVPLPDGYTDVCAYEGDLKALIATAEPHRELHYLERAEVASTLDEIKRGISSLELDRLLRRLPRLPQDELAVKTIREEIATRAKKAGHSAKVADAFVKSVQREQAGVELTAIDERLNGEATWPTAVDGAELLEEVRAEIKRFVFIPEEYTYDLLAAWVLQTFLFEEFPTTSYLHVTAPAKESGKTRLLEILEEYCRRALLAGGVSPAVLYRVVELHKPTLLIDEADTIFRDNSEASEAIRGILNNGYTRGKPIFRMERGPDDKQHPVAFDPYCPKALAGIGGVPDTIASRSIRIEMTRKKRGDEAARYTRREREIVRASAEMWRSKAHRWVQDRHGQFDIDPEFPEGLSDRTQDCWEPLLVVGELVGEGWPARLRTAAVTLNATRDSVDDDDLGTALLHDLRELLDRSELGEGPHVSTQVLLPLLNALDERPWPHLKNGPLNAMVLSKLMKSFDIRPGRFERNTVRGYLLAEIEQAIGRWL